MPLRDVHETPIVELSYDAGETIGWPAYVHEIANVYASLPAERRCTAVVLASSYGEAGAVDHYGPADGLPTVSRRQRRRAGHTGLGVLRSARTLDEDLADAAPLRVSGRLRLIRP